MIEIIDLRTATDKVIVLRDFIFALRDKCGGLIMALIIPKGYEGLMYNVKVEPHLGLEEIYLYGRFDVCHCPIYIDATLTDTIYLIGNNGTKKLKVANGQ